MGEKLDLLCFFLMVRNFVAIHWLAIARLSWEAPNPKDNVASPSTSLIESTEQRAWIDGKTFIRALGKTKQHRNKNKVLLHRVEEVPSRLLSSHSYAGLTLHFLGSPTFESNAPVSFLWRQFPLRFGRAYCSLRSHQLSMRNPINSHPSVVETVGIPQMSMAHWIYLKGGINGRVGRRSNALFKPRYSVYLAFFNVRTLNHVGWQVS